MKRRNALNDGFVTFGIHQTQRSERGKRIGEVFLPQGKLAYEEMSCRDEDYQLAQIMSKSLDLKIKTFYPPFLTGVNKSKLIIVRDGIKYDVIKCDADRKKRYLYFYLQEVGMIEQD